MGNRRVDSGKAHAFWGTTKTQVSREVVVLAWYSYSSLTFMSLAKFGAEVFFWLIKKQQTNREPFDLSFCYSGCHCLLSVDS